MIMRLDLTYDAHQFIFNFAFLIFLFIPCGRLSWLLLSFLLHVKYTLLYRIVSYCMDITMNGSLWVMPQLPNKSKLADGGHLEFQKMISAYWIKYLHQIWYQDASWPYRWAQMTKIATGS